MKYCTRCRRHRPKSTFGFRRASKDGLSHYCRECATAARYGLAASKVCPSCTRSRPLNEEHYQPVMRDGKHVRWHSSCRECRAIAEQDRRERRRQEDPVEFVESERTRRRRARREAGKRDVERAREREREKSRRARLDPKRRAKINANQRENYRARRAREGKPVMRIVERPEPRVMLDATPLREWLAREFRHWTAAEIASNANVDRSMVERVRSGALERVTLDTADAICVGLDCPHAFSLLYNDEDMAA